MHRRCNTQGGVLTWNKAAESCQPLPALSAPGAVMHVTRKEVSSMLSWLSGRWTQSSSCLTKSRIQGLSTRERHHVRLRRERKELYAGANVKELVCGAPRGFSSVKCLALQEGRIFSRKVFPGPEFVFHIAPLQKLGWPCF